MTDTEVFIHDAEPQDMPAVAEIMTHYVEHSVITFSEEPPSVTYWEEQLLAKQAGGHPFLVAEADDEVLGFAYVSPWNPKSAYRHTVENTIYLRPGTGGRGLGTSLLRVLMQRCAAAGHRHMIALLTDDESTRASYALHQRFGFTEIGRLRDVGIKHGRSLSVILMQCTLSAPQPAAGDDVG
ncbi:GNAT family N-acetyltransferase [Nesterenkonia flava]|uniref:N-acetyltransferase family protein n=1 Tax=Nesterenkonia flava TaxID=469799 RepID=A0ABU1FTG7_9MICC|nr:N-acetyltransferase family protein [Nesterenkonia flava]MDR5711958.1 N-acetyltransferase family protein [Nesterenkonia flava]